MSSNHVYRCQIVGAYLSTAATEVAQCSCEVDQSSTLPLAGPGPGAPYMQPQQGYGPPPQGYQTQGYQTQGQSIRKSLPFF
jgi:hypothetical protein